MFLKTYLFHPFYFDTDEGGGTGTPGQDGGTPTPPPAQAAPPATGDDAAENETLKAAFRKLRDTEDELARLRKAEKRRELESMSETERLKAEKNELEREIERVQTSANEQVARALVIEAATDKGFIAAEDAWHMLRGSLTVKNGEVEDLDQALASLTKKKPYLLKANGAGGNGSSRRAATTPGNTAATTLHYSKADLRKMTPEEIAKLWPDPEFQKDIGNLKD